METLHAHQVLNLLSQHGKDVTVSELKDLVTSQYGEEVSFGSCSSSGMTIEQLVQFFVSRGKVCFDGEKISLSSGCGCGH